VIIAGIEMFVEICSPNGAAGIGAQLPRVAPEKYNEPMNYLSYACNAITIAADFLSRTNRQRQRQRNRSGDRAESSAAECRFGEAKNATGATVVVAPVRPTQKRGRIIFSSLPAS
jgi:hypothetical protein